MQRFVAFLFAVTLLGRGALVWAEEPLLSPEFEALPEETLHLVSAGEDLHLLAAYYYGDARQWTRIYEVNRDTIKDPNLIVPGMLLRIPVEQGWRPQEPLGRWMERVHTPPAGEEGMPMPPFKIEAEPEGPPEIETEEGR